MTAFKEKWSIRIFREISTWQWVKDFQKKNRHLSDQNGATVIHMIYIKLGSFRNCENYRFHHIRMIEKNVPFISRKIIVKTAHKHLVQTQNLISDDDVNLIDSRR